MVDVLVMYRVSIGELLLGQPGPFAKEQAGYHLQRRDGWRPEERGTGRILFNGIVILRTNNLQQARAQRAGGIVRIDGRHDGENEWQGATRVTNDGTPDDGVGTEKKRTQRQNIIILLFPFTGPDAGVATLYATMAALLSILALIGMVHLQTGDRGLRGIKLGSTQLSEPIVTLADFEIVPIFRAQPGPAASSWRLNAGVPHLPLTACHTPENTLRHKSSLRKS